MTKRTRRDPAAEVERAMQALQEAQKNRVRKTGELAIELLGQDSKMTELAGAIKYALGYTTKAERIALGEAFFRDGASATTSRNARNAGGDASTVSSPEMPRKFTDRRAEQIDEPDVRPHDG